MSGDIILQASELGQGHRGGAGQGWTTTSCQGYLLRVGSVPLAFTLLCHRRLACTGSGFEPQLSLLLADRPLTSPGPSDPLPSHTEEGYTRQL